MIRAATVDHLEAINDIYNHYVATSHATFDEQPISMDARREWFSQFSDQGPHRVFVALEGDRVVGWASSGRVRPKPGYITSVETTIYLALHAREVGTGTRLYEALFDSLRGQPVHRAYAVIALPNPASVALHEKFGFQRVAHFSEQGRKFGRYWDVDWFEKPLEGAPPPI